MERSMNSMHKTQNSKAKTEDNYSSPEESSWTYYIQDFLCENHEKSSFASGCESLPLITDAASSAAKKASHDKRNDHSSSFRKRKVKGTTPLGDDDLEDTASSPVNSPKVSYMNEFHQVKQQEAATTDISEGKMKTSGGNGLAVDRRDSGITELKKRGLCLVPLSTIANLL